MTHRSSQGWVWAVLSAPSVSLTAVAVPDLAEIDRAFDALARDSIDGLIVMPDPVALLQDGDPP